jgi:hypothetical protein
MGWFPHFFFPSRVMPAHCSLYGKQNAHRIRTRKGPIMLSAIQSWIKSKKRKNRGSAARRTPGRTLRVESLERRELLAADMAGVVRGSNQYLLDTNRDPAVEIDRAYGLKNDIHVTGNWQGKGHFPGVVRAGHPDGLLRWYLDTNGDRNHDIEIAFGLPGDIPVVGDWNGDGRDDVGVVRRGGDGLLRWYLDTNGDPNHEMEYVFGLPGDIPVTGDWNGDGRSDVGVVRRGGDGLLHWYLNTDNDPAHEDHYVFGRPGDIPVTGDWNGDGRTDVGVVRADAKGFLNWYLNTDRDPEHEHTFIFGRTGDKPITGIWKMPEVTVAGGDLDADGALNFGAIEVGQSAPTRKIVLRNDGTTNLALSVAKVPRGFAVVTGLPSSLRPGRTATVVLRMESTTVARFNDQLRIATNDGNETTLAFAVKGEVKERPAPQVKVDWRVPSGTRFNIADGGRIVMPDAVQGYTDGQIRIRITNTGTAPLKLSQLYVPPGFVRVGGSLSDALPGQSKEIIVALDTSELGTRQSRLTFSTNDPKVGQFDIVLRGTVQAARPQAGVTYTTPASGFGPVRGGVADGGSVDPWRVGEIATFTVRNEGNAPMTIGQVRRVGAYSVVLQPVKSQLAPGETVEFKLLRHAGDYRGEVFFATNGVTDGEFDFRIDYGDALTWTSTSS